ncbi:hypothetical protein AMST5_00816 [freshwater sediment metagenome]|uniref:Uncharacterized protein n=1 Tax=freshwater sediment metagenome TaxID=556182 RepID=A0AA48LXN5_9ZZZZ
MTQSMITPSQKGIVLSIQHFCTDDGPGIRTTFFLKFCSLRCKVVSDDRAGLRAARKAVQTGA